MAWLLWMIAGGALTVVALFVVAVLCCKEGHQELAQRRAIEMQRMATERRMDQVAQQTINDMFLAAREPWPPAR